MNIIYLHCELRMNANGMYLYQQPLIQANKLNTSILIYPKKQ